MTKSFTTSKINAYLTKYKFICKLSENLAMSKKIIILTIPGIGTKETGYSKKFEKDLISFSKRTPLENNFRIIETKPFNSTEVDENQRSMFQRLDSKNKLGGILSFRRFVLEAFGDGVTFERGADDPNSVYRKVHEYLRSKIKEANLLMNQFDQAKLVIVAGSLGAHILSTYIWDADNKKGIFEKKPASQDENLKNLNYLATIGCNIPLFVSGYREDQIIAFEKRNDSFIWDNYYDRDDVLGWPLKQLSPSYEKLVNDFEINTGLYVGSHVKYWDDNDFTKPFTKKLVDLIT
jgi:hypothetical protein